MPEELKRVRLGPDTDLRQLLDDMKADRSARLIERDGEPLAVVMDAKYYSGPGAVPKSQRLKQQLRSLAGVWQDLDADQMIEELYQARHAGPSSPSVQE